jgi:cysteine desulfurase/selenocysteine lyase
MNRSNHETDMWTIEDIQSDEQLRIREFPVCKDQVFLSHAAVCPLPASVSQAIADYASACQFGDQEDAAVSLNAQTRLLAANLLGVQLSEVALVGPTSLALSFVASGFPWRRGDAILVYQDDYPSNVYPWMALSEWGVEVRFLNVSSPGGIRCIDVEGQIDENVRMVALASCHFLSGFRLEVEAMGRMLKERGIAFCLDAIQTIGAFPTPLDHVDFMAADAHKWMLGPCAAGLMIVKESMQDVLQPTTFGWHNVQCPDFVTAEDLILAPDARRYEAGSHNSMGIVGLNASLKLLQRIGIDNIARDLLAKRRLLVDELTQKKYRVMHADVEELHASGMVTFDRAGEDMRATHQRLKEKHIFTALRSDRHGRAYIRVSPHFYNTNEDLLRFLEAL